MNILHIYKDYYPVLGGIENHIKALAEAQAAAGHRITVLVCGRKWQTREELIGGVRIIKSGRLATVASMPISFAQPFAMRRMRPDLVHVHSPYPLGELANWILGCAPVTIITYQSDVVRQQAWLRFYGPLLRRVLDSADRIIVTSPRYRDSSPWLRPVRKKCVVIPLGVDLMRFSPAEQTPDGPLHLLFVGRLRYYKGLDTLLRALIHMPCVSLSVVGEGPMERQWSTLSRELQLTDRVAFAGEVDDEELAEWYRRADIFVLPANARSEAFGTVLLEAMASGLPCVTTEVGTGTSWVVEHGVNGLIVPPDDPQRLSEAIAVLSRDRGLRLKMGMAGRKRAETTFALDQMIDRVENLYHDMVG